MYAPAGHSEVRAETVSKAWDWLGLLRNAAMEEGERGGGKKKSGLSAAHLWIILANCVHFSVHSTLGLSSKHKEEIKSAAAMLLY